MKNLVLILSILVGISLHLSGFDPNVLKVQSASVKHVATKHEMSQESKKYFAEVDVTDIHIGTLQDGRWFYGFKLYNKSDNIVLRKDQFSLIMAVEGQRNSNHVTLQRELFPKKQMLVRGIFKHYYPAKDLTIKFYKKGSYSNELLFEKKADISKYDYRDSITFTNAKLVNGKDVEYCIRNNSPYNLSTTLNPFSSSQLQRPLPQAEKTTFLLERRKTKCGIISFDIKPIGNTTIHLQLKDNNAYGEDNQKDITRTYFTIPVHQY